MIIEAILTAKALSERIAVTEGCLAKWRISGEGPAFVRIGRRIGYRPEAVNDWLASRTVNSTSELAA
jgi:predicted DNA-binding transcriptional regulator AlpA